MARLGRKGSLNPRVIRLARRILVSSGAPERDKLSEVIAIHQWTKANTRYTNDSADGEVLSDLGEMLDFYGKYGQIPGDCDELVILEDALLRSVGFDTRYVTISRAQHDPMNRMSHVYLEADVNGDWIPLDPILKNRPAGYGPQSYTARVNHDIGGLNMSNGFQARHFVPVCGANRTMGRYDLGAEAVPAKTTDVWGALTSLATTGINIYATRDAIRREGEARRAAADLAAARAQQAQLISQQQAAGSTSTSTSATGGTNWSMMGMIALGAFAAAKIFKVF
jgi:hypothetical protein